MHRPDAQAIGSPDEPTVLDLPNHGAGDQPTLAPGQQLGPYRIEALLGEGGMGAVYLAQQLEPVQRPVAMKLIRDQLRGSLAEAYFLVERQALARMDHPAIARIYDAGTTPQGFPYFAMEYVAGATLAAYCAGHAQALRERLALFVRICRGVQHAHQKGVIHRDLKPSNVLVTEIDGQPQPKIIDFGVAIGAAHGSHEGRGTALMQRAGTRGYMSPEQAAGQLREIDVRSDVYALGVMLLELLVPATMFEAASAAGIDNVGLQHELAASVGDGRAASAAIASALARVPAELRWVVAKAMQPQRSERYESADALAADLGRFLARRPVHAVPPTRAYRMGRFIARHRGAMAAAALALLALLAGSGAALYGMLQARAAEKHALIEAEKSRATSKFLTDILSGVDARQARDLDKTLLHLVLDKAADRAGRELAHQPEVLADIEATIGASYDSLGEYQRALAHTQRAYDLARASAGATAPLTLGIEQLLAGDLSNTGKLKEAGELSARNLETLTRLRGADDPAALNGALDLIRNLREQGSFAEAECRLAAIESTVERVDGADGRMTVVARDLHAILLADLGRYEESEPRYRDVIAQETRLWGETDPRTIDSKNGLAILYLESHRFAEGARILEELLPVCEKIYGPQHGVTINIVSNLAGALRQQGTPERIAESGPYYRRALEGTRAKYGERHTNTIIATHNYANWLLDNGDVATAVALQQQALAAATDLLGPDHGVTGEIEYGLGKALLRAGRHAEAEKALLAAIAEKQKDFGADHWRMDEYLAPLIDLYRSWNRPEQLAHWQAQRAALKPNPGGNS
jgi:non-specific serine/threonine protein kinase/serine/threonine-protein kinase